MSAEPGGEGRAGGPGAPSEEELRAAYEAELARVDVTDLIAQSTVTLLNVAARRLAPPAAQEGARRRRAARAGAAGGRDLEQVRDAIDAARALLEILERRMPREARPLRDALSQLQMAYAAEVRAGAGRGGCRRRRRGTAGARGEAGGGRGAAEARRGGRAGRRGAAPGARRVKRAPVGSG